MNLLITYFSGTGNTAFVAERLARRLRAAKQDEGVPPATNHAVSCMPIERVGDPELTAADIVVLGFPVYACDAPAPVYEFVGRTVPTSTSRAPADPARPTPIVLFCTKGLVAGSALQRLARAVASTRFRVAGGITILMPGSDALLYSQRGGRYHRWATARDYDTLSALDRLVALVERVATSGGESRARLPLSIAGVIVGWFLRPLYIMMERRLGSRFSADERCGGCRICEEICSVGNITVDAVEPRPAPGGGMRRSFTVTFDDRCILCLRCVTQCPTEAIQIGKWSEGTVRWHGPDGTFDPRLDHQAGGTLLDQRL